MLQQYAWAIGISVLVNSNMSVGAPCPTSVTRSARGIAVRFKKTKAGMIQCHRILRKLDPEGGRDLVLRTAEYHRVRRELNSLPLRQSWFDHGGYFARNGSAYWGWAWEDDPYGVMFMTRSLFRNALLPIVQSTKPTCPGGSVVVHFRCSDVPFCRRTYTLLRHSWYLSALDSVPGSDSFEVCLLSCPRFQTPFCLPPKPEGVAEQRGVACLRWAEGLRDDMRKHPRVKGVELKCGSVERDMAAMVHARALVA
eukprot:Hpha_TRINITY_DN15276_c0_g1::TRINITY_DN15276_c0_g1_i1::g.66474::m.66474